jgi:4-hydroxybenzoate polyprenyltransferase
MSSSILNTIALLRIRQWTKNLLVFAALLFTRSFEDSNRLLVSIWAFLAMSLISSAIYVFNDLKDVESDRLHPEKKSRPLASGKVRSSTACILGLLCLAGGLALGFYINQATFATLLFYIALQIAYNLGVKHKPIADVFAVSLGFVIRAALGAVAIDVAISGWLLLCTLALALLLSLGKRRHEFILMGDNRGVIRASLNGYTQQTLDALVILSACCAALFYGIYAVDSQTARNHPGLIVTVLFVFYGVSRYVFLIFSRGEGGEPDTIMVRDRHIILCLILFVIAAALAMKGFSLPFIESGSSLR